MAEHRAPDLEGGPLARWRELSPVRTALYPVALAVVALLVGYGVVAEARAGLWIALVTAVLMPAGIEVARRAAWSPNSVREVRQSWAEYSRDEYARGVADALHSTPDRAAAGTRLRDDELEGGAPPTT